MRRREKGAPVPVRKWLPYALVFWLAALLHEGYRVAPGTGLAKLATLVSVPPSLSEISLLPYDPSDWLPGLVVSTALFGYVTAKRWDKKKFRKSVEYGSARWGTEKDIEPFIDPAFRKNIILTQTERLMMNNRPADPLVARNKNVVVIGGSGSGKTRFFVKPNLMQCHSSYVVTDPKGDILPSVGNLLKRRKYRIKVFNTINFQKSMHYNPFRYIRSEKDILKLVNALIENTKGEGKGGDDFWIKSETLLYCALIGFIHYEAPTEEQNMTMLVDMINAMSAREDDEDYRNAVDMMFEILENKNPDHFAVRQYRKYKLAAGKTAKSILISCGARLAPFDIQEIREITAYDELELDTLGESKAALFVIISDTDSTFNFLVALMYSQLFNLLCDKADDEHGGRLPVPVRCLLDEFSNIGKIPNFEKLIATIRSREISACLILQSQSQLKAIYKESMDTILDNCDSYLFLGGTSKTTLKDLTEKLGKETINLYNTSENRGREKTSGISYQTLGRTLMDLDEIAVMPRDECILQIGGVRPFHSKKFDITGHPDYKYLADYNKRNVFDISKFLNTRADVKADEVCEVYEVNAG
ncbi:MAG: type IV secretory system conjugative DNA transfer family protein [Ethanoligenens sp.]